MNLKKIFFNSSVLAFLYWGQLGSSLAATNYSQEQAELISQAQGQITLELDNLETAALFCKNFALSFEQAVGEYYNDFSEDDKFVFYKVPLAKQEFFKNHNFGTEAFNLFKRKILARAYVYTDELTSEHGFDEDYLYFPEFLINNNDIRLKIKQLPAEPLQVEEVEEDVIYTYSYLDQQQETNYLSFITIGVEQVDLANSYFLGASFNAESNTPCSLLVQ